MAQDRGSYGWRLGQITIPLILIALGILFLLSNLGILPRDLWPLLWKLWPLILILLGVEAIMGRAGGWGLAAIVLLVIAILFGVVFWLSFFRYPGGLNGRGAITEELEEDLRGLSQAEVVLRLGGGSLWLEALPPDSDKLMKGQVTHHRAGTVMLRKKMEERGGKGFLRLTSTGRTPFFDGGEQWRIGLSPKIPLNLAVQAGAVQGDMDLTALKLTELRLDIGASDFYVRFPSEAGLTTATIKAGAARLVLDIPQGVAARIESKAGLASLVLDEGRFPKSNGYYMSKGFDTATDKVNLRLDVGVSSVTIK